MKLSLTVVCSIVVAGALAAPLSERRKDDKPTNYSSWGLEDKREGAEREEKVPWNWQIWAKEEKRAEAVEAREEDAITYPMWNKEDKRTDKALWGGTNWALEERDVNNGLKRREEGSLLLRVCGWGVEDLTAPILTSIVALLTLAAPLVDAGPVALRAKTRDEDQIEVFKQKRDEDETDIFRRCSSERDEDSSDIFRRC
ncbi:hypothetical protein EV715DRAFT_295933 [Schizophyllum commune]